MIAARLRTIRLLSYAAFFSALILAHRARTAAAIFFLEAADIVCFGATLVVFAAAAGCDPFLIAAHRALCASTIFRREASEIIRFG